MPPRPRHAADIGKLLRHTRTQRQMSRETLARRAKVSVRLVAELERGERANVSLETALRLLELAGLTVEVSTPDGQSAYIRTKEAEKLARQARAEYRRTHWTWGWSRLHEENDPPVPVGAHRRFLAVAEVTQNAYAVARSAARVGGGKRRETP